VTAGFDDVTKVYHTRRGPRTVLDHISFTVRKGQHVGILGRNGSGKSTLIKLLAGAEMPTSGHVRRDMKLSWPLSFGGAFQDVLTGRDNVRFISRIYNVDYRTILPFVEEFAAIGIYMREPLWTFSSGMRARLAFGISLAIDFDCYLIDEVTAVGDSRFRERCEDELFQKRKDRGLVFVSHSKETIAEHCESAMVLSGGRLHAFDKIDQAYDFYENSVN
jgi:capsular polysaccharide transport system ATP-binding protein